MKKYLTNSSLETKNLGSNFAKQLKSGDVILLFGELGAGKTTFVQGLAEGLGITDRILSPTFVIHRSHKIPYSSSKQSESRSSRQARTIKFNHVDLYRIEGKEALDSLGLIETIKEPGSITVIEWADRLSDFKHKQGYKIWFDYIDENQRQIRIVPMVVSIRDPARMKFVGKKI